MASNLKSARQAIEAELAHARQGAAFYTARVEALETALQQLESVEGDSTARGANSQAAGGRKKGAAAGAHRGRRANGANGTARRATANGSARQHGESKRGRKARAANGAKRSGGLSTSGDFWLSLVDEQPRSAVDIANAAIETLGIKPDQKEEIQKLKQRVSPALAGLVSAHKINDSGSGRARRFFKGAQAGAA